MEGQLSLENKVEGIEGRLKAAQNNAISTIDAQLLLERMQFLKDGHDDTSLEMKDILKQLQQSMVVVHTLEEFEVLLEKTGVSQEQKEALLRNRKSEDMHEGYSLIVMRGEHGFRYKAVEIISHQEVLPEPRQKGIPLSEGDRLRIEEIRRELGK